MFNKDRKKETIIQYTKCFDDVGENIAKCKNVGFSDYWGSVLEQFKNVKGAYFDGYLNDTEFCYWCIASMRVLEEWLKVKGGLKNE